MSATSLLGEKAVGHHVFSSTWLSTSFQGCLCGHSLHALCSLVTGSRLAWQSLSSSQSFIYYLFNCVFWDRISLYNSGWTGIHYADQASLKLTRDLPTSASQLQLGFYLRAGEYLTLWLQGYDLHHIYLLGDSLICSSWCPRPRVHLPSRSLAVWLLLGRYIHLRFSCLRLSSWR